jgi:hypothetical protein
MKTTRRKKESKEAAKANMIFQSSNAWAAFPSFQLLRKIIIRKLKFLCSLLMIGIPLPSAADKGAYLCAPRWISTYIFTYTGRRIDSGIRREDGTKRYFTCHSSIMEWRRRREEVSDCAPPVITGITCWTNMCTNNANKAKRREYVSATLLSVCQYDWLRCCCLFAWQSADRPIDRRGNHCHQLRLNQEYDSFNDFKLSLHRHHEPHRCMNNFHRHLFPTCVIILMLHLINRQ